MGFIRTTRPARRKRSSHIQFRQRIPLDWQYPDPNRAYGEEWERRKELSETLAALERQFSAFNQLPVTSLEEKSLQAKNRAA